VSARLITIQNKLGLHARAAAKWVSLASRFSCQIRLGRSEDAAKCVDGKSIMSVMLLAAGKGRQLYLHCEGEDQEKAETALVALVDNLFDEGI